MKRLLITVVAACLMMSLLITGCTSGTVQTEQSSSPAQTAKPTSDTPSTTDSGTSLVTGPGEMPIVTQDLTVTISMTQNPHTTDYEDNYLNHYFKEKTGIEIDVFLFPTNGEEAKQKLALMVASNQTLPDVINLALSEAEKASYGSQGKFLALNDYLDNLAFYWKTAQEQWCTEDDRKNMIVLGTSPDGNIYGFPYFAVDPSDAQAEGLWINKDWLDALGLEMPTTTEEFYDVLIAFRDQDPNGNGLQDEIPLIGNTGWVGNVTRVLMNSFIYYSEYMLNAEEGVISAPYIQDDFREGLRYIHKLSDEGLLSPLSFTQGYAEVKAMMSVPDDEPTLIGAFCGHPALVFTTDGSSSRAMEYATMAPLVGPEGIAYAPSSVDKPNFQTYITSDCEHPEAAFRLLDFFCDTSSTLSIRFGEEDVNWKYTDEGKSAFPEDLGFSVVFTTIGGSDNVWVNENNTVWHTNINFLAGRLFGGLVSSGYPNEISEYLYKDLWFDTMSLRYGKNPDELVSTLIFTEAESNAISEIESTIKTYVAESMVRFTVGDLDIESDWDSYLNDLDVMGISDYLDIVQICYTRMNSGS